MQQRWFRLGSSYHNDWFVGGVCTPPDAQRRGLGSALMRVAEQGLAALELDFSVLNCGERVVPFYEQIGYTRISDKALYLRDGAAVVDDDPVLAISLHPHFDISTLCVDVFPLGFDF